MYPVTRVGGASAKAARAGQDTLNDFDDRWSAPCSERADAWMEDVALELWVDAERNPILVRLAGTLDQATAGNLVPVLDELIADGARSFEFDIRALQVLDTRGADALLNVQRHVHRSGGRFSWLDDLPHDAQPSPAGDHHTLYRREP